MTSYTDYHCGISQPHKHTGILHEAYYIQYWCTKEEGWVDRSGPDVDGTMPTHCRTQSTTTEVIELLGDWTDPLSLIIKEELRPSLEKQLDKLEREFLYGDDTNG